MTKKKQCKLQATAKEFVENYQSISSSEQHSEVSMDSQQSEDSDFGFQKYQNTFEYYELSEIMERTAVSNRDACKSVNACMKDLGFDSPVYVLDPAKLKRQRKHWREELCTRSQTYQ